MRVCRCLYALTYGAAFEFDGGSRGPKILGEGLLTSWRGGGTGPSRESPGGEGGDDEA